MLTPRRLLDVVQLIATGADARVRRQLAATLLLVTAGAMLAGLAPLALKELIDSMSPAAQGNGPSASGSTFAFGLAYLLLLGGGRLLSELRPAVTGTAEQSLLGSLRKRFFAHLLHLRLEFHLGRRTGALLYSLHQATAACQLFIAGVVTGILPVIAELVTVCFVLAQLETGGLVPAFLVTAMAYLVVYVRGAPALRARTQAVSDASLNMHAQLVDGLLNCETIKCFNAERATGERLNAASDELRERWSRMLRQRSLIGLCAALAFIASMAASLTIAASAVADGTLTIGGFVLAHAGMLQIVRPLEMLGTAARDVSQSVVLIQPLIDVLNEPAELMTEPEAVGRPVGRHPPGVSFRGVHFAYGCGAPVLRGLDLEIPAGQSVAIVGASGSGKSSLVRLLLRLYAPQAGHITLDGTPIEALDVARLRELIGLVPQDTTLLDASIAANIALGRPDASIAEIEDAARAAQLHDFVASLPAGYETPVSERGLRLSGGERQRVAIARAVLKQPGLYVFDESTSMLDGDTEDALLRQLRRISAGCTTITIAHRLSTARFADEIVVLEDGVIAERGSHAGLMRRGGAYARLWQNQTRVDA